MEHYLNKINSSCKLNSCPACDAGYVKLKPLRTIYLKEKDTLKKVNFNVSEKLYNKFAKLCKSSCKKDIEITIGKNVYIMSTPQ